MNKVLITGSGGFLGKHIINEFNKYNNCILLAPPSNELNLLEEQLVQKYLWENKPNYVLHLAARCGGIGINSRLSADFLMDNIIMGINLYKNAQQFGNVEKIYCLGSVCSYPKYCQTPFKEDDLWNGYPEDTNAPYGHAKRTLLMMSQTYRRQYNLGGAFFVPVNMYGIEDHFDLENSHVIPALINKFVNAQENNLPNVKCWGTGQASREFLNARDAAEIIVNSVLSGFDHPEPINLGTGIDITIKDLASLISGLVGYKGKIIFTEEVSDGQPKRQLDVSRAKELLNWEAKINLRDGLVEVIDWYRKNK